MAQQGAKFAVDTSVGNRYRVLRLIARGGMGEIYEVEDGKTKRHLALKVLPGINPENVNSRRPAPPSRYALSRTSAARSYNADT